LFCNRFIQRTAVVAEQLRDAAPGTSGHGGVQQQRDQQAERQVLHHH
jgi:hypothetical protein